MRSPWKLLAALEALALLAVFVLWPRGATTGNTHPRSAQESRNAGVAEQDDAPETRPDDAREAGAGVAGRENLVTEPPPPAADDPLGILVYGHVCDESGAAIPGYYVSLDEQTGSPVQVSTDDSGNYAIPGLKPGNYSLNGRARGFLAFEGTLEVAESPTTQRHDFVAERAQSYTVRLETSTGEELFAWLSEHVGKLSDYRRAISVVMSPQPQTSFAPSRFGTPRTRYGSMSGRNSPAGRELNSEYSGRLELAAPLPMFATAVFQHQILGSTALQPDVESVTILVDERKILNSIGSVRMRVVDDLSGQPVEGATVSLSDGSGGTGRPITGEDGYVEFEQLPPGILVLEVYHKDYALLWQSLFLEIGASRELGDVRLAPNATLAVTAVLPDGSPASAAPFAFAASPPEWSLGRTRYQSFRLDGDGQMEHPRMPAGQVRVIAKETETTARQVVAVNLTPGNRTQVEMRLESGTEVTVRTEVDFYAGYRLTLLDVQGQELGPPLPTGLATLRLAPGRYRIAASRLGAGVIASKEFTVAAEPVRVELELP